MRIIVLTLGLVLEESIDLGGGTRIVRKFQVARSSSSPVVGTDLESLVVHVEDQVLALKAE
jgi:hypothetical protein